MKVYIDADACPVVDEVIEICSKYDIDSIIVCDDSHVIKKEGVLSIVVEKGFDSADYKILSLVTSSDLVVTNDYGLSALVLAKKCRVIDFNGKIINDLIIDSMLESRAFSAKMRKSNVRMKGPSKRNKNQNSIFKDEFKKVVKNK